MLRIRHSSELRAWESAGTHFEGTAERVMNSQFRHEKFACRFKGCGVLWRHRETGLSWLTAILIAYRVLKAQLRQTKAIHAAAPALKPKKVLFSYQASWQKMLVYCTPVFSAVPEQYAWTSRRTVLIILIWNQSQVQDVPVTRKHEPLHHENCNR